VEVRASGSNTSSNNGVEPKDWLSQARRGVLELCVLSLIAQAPRYGYQLATALGMWKPLACTEGTLYPLLRRLQRDGIVEASWQESAGGPPRKYYRLTPAGQQLLDSQTDEWLALTDAVANLRAHRHSVDEEVPDGTGSDRQSALPGRAPSAAGSPAGR
jgi:PadR family transcriptional regulator PadR